MNHTETKLGVTFALGAYTMWGIAPIYFKQLSQVPPTEILAHRIIWSCVLLALLSLFARNWSQIIDITKNRRKLSLLLLTSTLIAINWLIFIWAVGNQRMLEASLGYYINPLVNVILGLFFFSERLRKLQCLALIPVILSVAIEIIKFGSLPWVSLALGFSFGFYGMFRKKLKMNAQIGLLLETLLLFPVALIYMVWFTNTPTSQFSNNSLQLNLLLLSAGLVTTIPLLCFTAAATRLKLSTLGFIQYIGPSLMFLLALFYGEPFTTHKAITFGLIWVGLIIFTYDGIRHTKTVRTTPNR